MQKASKNAEKKQPMKKFMSHRMVEIGRLLCRSSGPTHLLKQGHLNHSAQDGQVVQMASPQTVTPQPNGKLLFLLGHSHSKNVFPDVQRFSVPVSVYATASGPVTWHH